jgi:hypothetical protein
MHARQSVAHVLAEHYALNLFSPPLPSPRYEFALAAIQPHHNVVSCLSPRFQ